jgi:hypothetical protein
MAAKKYLEVEARFGRPLRSILCEMFELYGDQPSAQELIAEKLGVSQGTLSTWIRLEGLKSKTILVPDYERTPEQVAPGAPAPATVYPIEHERVTT